MRTATRPLERPLVDEAGGDGYDASKAAADFASSVTRAIADASFDIQAVPPRPPRVLSRLRPLPRPLSRV
jgi:hypothetical protein